MQSCVGSDIRKVDMNSNGISDEDRPTSLSFLSGGDRQRYAPESSDIIGHFDDWQRLAQEIAQAHHDARDAMEAARKKLEQSNQTLAEAESTEPRRGTPRVEAARGKRGGAGGRSAAGCGRA